MGLSHLWKSGQRTFVFTKRRAFVCGLCPTWRAPVSVPCQSDSREGRACIWIDGLLEWPFVTCSGPVISPAYSFRKKCISLHIFKVGSQPYKNSSTNSLLFVCRMRDALFFIIIYCLKQYITMEFRFSENLRIHYYGNTDSGFHLWAI